MVISRYVEHLSGTTAFNLEYIFPLVLLFFFAIALIQFLVANKIARFGHRVFFDQQNHIHSHILRLPVNFHLQKKAGDLLRLGTYDVYLLSSFISGSLLRLIPQLVMTFGAFTFLFIINPALALPFILLVPFVILFPKLASRRLRDLARKIRLESTKLQGIMEDDFRNINAVKSFTMETFEESRFETKSEKIHKLSTQMSRWQATIRPLTEVLVATIMITCLWIWRDSLGLSEMSLADIINFLLYTVISIRPISGLVGFWGQLNLAEGSLTRMHDVLGVTQENYTDGTRLKSVQGHISFKNVGFTYGDRKNLFTDLSLEISPDQVIALIGQNGVGKTTLTDLLQRFQNPDNGEIFLDGIETKNINLTSLRSHIGTVPQTPLLFESSLLSNIKFGNVNATEAELQHAITLSQLGPLLSRCKSGLNTQIGEQGVRLSGGEKQRVALARALLKNPKILILDEPTAMFDPISEQQFLKNMNGICKDRTVILITHRPLTLKSVNRIVSFNSEGISETRPMRSTK